MREKKSRVRRAGSKKKGEESKSEGTVPNDSKKEAGERVQENEKGEENPTTRRMGRKPAKKSRRRMLKVITVREPAVPKMSATRQKCLFPTNGGAVAELRVKGPRLRGSSSRQRTSKRA